MRCGSQFQHWTRRGTALPSWRSAGWDSYFLALVLTASLGSGCRSCLQGFLLFCFRMLKTYYIHNHKTAFLNRMEQILVLRELCNGINDWLYIFNYKNQIYSFHLVNFWSAQTIKEAIFQYFSFTLSIKTFLYYN